MLKYVLQSKTLNYMEIWKEKVKYTTVDISIKNK